MYEYKAKILSVYDGDGSFKAEIDMGMNIRHVKDVRLFGVDTPELRGRESEAGKVVRDIVKELILDKEVIIRTKKDKTGKYGRLLAEVIYNEGSQLASFLLRNSLAKPYLGGTKLKWEDEELKRIVDASGKI